MTDPTPLSVGLGFLAFGVLALTILALLSLLPRDRTQDAPLMEAEPASPCDEHNPHRMLPTAYGWRCANDCGESWYVEESDDLATADLALWELQFQSEAQS